MLKDRLQSLAETHLEPDVKKQKEAFLEWEKKRDVLLEEQRLAYEVQAKKLALAAKLQQLQAREEKLRFFEEEDRISLGLEKSENMALRKKQVNDVDLSEEGFVAPPGERK